MQTNSTIVFLSRNGFHFEPLFRVKATLAMTFFHLSVLYRIEPEHAVQMTLDFITFSNVVAQADATAVAVAVAVGTKKLVGGRYCSV